MHSGKVCSCHCPENAEQDNVNPELRETRAKGVSQGIRAAKYTTATGQGISAWPLAWPSCSNIFRFFDFEQPLLPQIIRSKMPEALYPVPEGLVRGNKTVGSTLSSLRLVILACIGLSAVASRLFAVIRFESIIHEL